MDDKLLPGCDWVCVCVNYIILCVEDYLAIHGCINEEIMK